MKNEKSFVAVLFVAVAFACLQTAALGQAPNQSANVRADGRGVRFDSTIPYTSATLTISAPDGNVYRREFGAGTAPSFALLDKAGATLGNGQYTYELRFNTAQARDPKERLVAAPDDGVEDEQGRTSRTRSRVQSVVQSGSFAVQNGTLYVGNEIEPTSGRPSSTKNFPTNPQQQRSTGVISGNTLNRLRNHRLSLFSAPDVVTADDAIIQGSLCVGLDCVNNENFGFDTIRLKENNDRIQFDDTSTSAGFPTNNWQIRANSSASGGESFLGFVDQGATGNSETGTIVLQVNAGAPANSIKVDSTGRLGLRTATPVLDVHANTSNTPAIRLEQNNGGGFVAQTWDIAGNEANFFVRDVTGGSRLPFRIRPGAPTSSIDISASGNVGIGTASPSSKLDVAGTLTLTTSSFANGPSISNQGDGLLLVAGTTLGARINNQNNTVELVRVTNTGNVGIGTAAPTQLLSVNGTAGKPGGGTWDVFSDERLKNIKGRYNTGLKALMQLQPIRYEYKPNNPLGIKSEGENIGFGAQSLQKIIPEAVTMNSAGYLMVKSDPILWTMLNAIKEQQKEIAELKGQVQKLRAASHKRRR
jgi:hypothetical protein